MQAMELINEAWARLVKSWLSQRTMFLPSSIKLPDLERYDKSSITIAQAVLAMVFTLVRFQDVSSIYFFC
jgi:hypothetical protein